MKLLMFLILQTLIAIRKAENIEIRCKTYVHNFTFVGSINVAESTDHSLTIEEDNVVADMIFDRAEELVEGFRALNKSIKFIPAFKPEISQSFKVLTVKKSKLAIVRQKNLRNFINLEWLNLEENEVQNIPKNLFEFNTKLKVVRLSRNKIKVVHPTVFEPLKDLIQLEFIWNICFSGFANTTSQLEDLKLVLSVRCSTNVKLTIANLTSKIESLDTKSDKYFITSIILLTSISIFLICSKVYKLFSPSAPLEPLELYKTPFYHQDSYKVIPQQPINHIMSCNHFTKMSRQHLDDSNRNIDRKGASVDLNHRNSSGIFTDLAEVYQSPVDEQIYHEVVYDETSVARHGEDLDEIEEELYSEVVQVPENEEHDASLAYSSTKKRVAN